MRLIVLLMGFITLADFGLSAPSVRAKEKQTERPVPEKSSKTTTIEPLKTPKPEPADEAETPGAFQGDMMLTDEQQQQIQEAIDEEETGRKKRKATIYESHRWTSRVDDRRYKIVPYVITPSLRRRSSLIRRAMDHWEENTCLRFEPRTSSHSEQLGHNSYISFFRGSGCWSHIGRAYDGVQQISIGNGCAVFGTIVHEIGHAIGFHHEQSRPDRDAYINVHYGNVLPGREHEFARYTWGRVTSEDVGYDVGSIMHYGEYAFSSNNRRTITTRDPGLQHLLGQRTTLSAADIELANLIYECNDVEDCSTADACMHGGYHDTECDCVCPEGYSGDVCQNGGPMVRPECLATFTDLYGVITSPNYPSNYDDDMSCVYRIEGPPGSTIRLTFRDMNIENEALCRYDYVEVRKDDINVAGEKFCGNTLPPVQVSTGNEMVVVFVSDPSFTRQGFWAFYVIVIESVPTTDVLTTTDSPTTTPMITTENTRVETTTNSASTTPIITTHRTTTNDLLTTPLNTTEMTTMVTTTDSTTTTPIITTQRTTTGDSPTTTPITTTDITIEGTTSDSATTTPMTTTQMTTTRDSSATMQMITRTDMNTEVTATDSITTTTRIATTEITTEGTTVDTATTTSQTTSDQETTDDPVIGTCGGNFFHDHGSMASPDYPHDYANSLRCVYVIEVEVGRRVELRFEDFALEDEVLCRWDSLEINLGDGIKLDMKMCGHEYPATSLISLGNRMVLTLVTDGTVTSRGFVAKYRAINV